MGDHRIECAERGTAPRELWAVHAGSLAAALRSAHRLLAEERPDNPRFAVWVDGRRVRPEGAEKGGAR